MRWYALILIGIAFTSVSLAGAATGPADLTFKVDSTADLVDVKLADGKCQASNGKCTLQAALNGVSAMKSKGQPVRSSSRTRITTSSSSRPRLRRSTRTAATSASSRTTRPALGDHQAALAKRRFRSSRERVLELSAPEPVTLTGVTITGGSVVNRAADREQRAGRPDADQLEITGNSADEGGGICNRPLKIDSTIISDNHATGADGGIAMNTSAAG